MEQLDRELSVSLSLSQSLWHCLKRETQLFMSEKYSNKAEKMLTHLSET